MLCPHSDGPMRNSFACFKNCSNSMSSARLARRSHARQMQQAPTPYHERMKQMPGILPQIDEADGVLDELQAWFLARAEAERWVYTSVLRQLVNRMYRDRDYLDRRKREGRHTAYDYAVDRDLKALAWAIRAIVRYTPAEEKARPEPPKPPRKPSR